MSIVANIHSSKVNALDTFEVSATHRTPYNTHGARGTDTHVKTRNHSMVAGGGHAHAACVEDEAFRHRIRSADGAADLDAMDLRGRHV